MPTCAAVRAGGEHRRDAVTVGDAAGRDERQADVDRREQLEQRRWLAVVAPRPAMAAGLGALDDERVDACVARRTRLMRRR